MKRLIIFLLIIWATICVAQDISQDANISGDKKHVIDFQKAPQMVKPLQKSNPDKPPRENTKIMRSALESGHRVILEKNTDPVSLSQQQLRDHLRSTETMRANK